MKIVIDISKKLYTDIRDSWNITLGSKNTDKVIKAIKNGTPLPENHGRLIDADALLQKHRDIDAYPFPSTTIRNAPTIIEADKEN